VIIMPRLYSVGEASKLLGVTIKTIREWDRLGKIRTIKTPGGHRRIPKEEINRITSTDSHTPYKKVVVYGRVSTSKQADNGNLERQLTRLREYANKKGYEIEEEFSEIDSGINEDRVKLNKMLEFIKKNEIQYIIIEYKDRLAHFGYNYLEKYVNDKNTEIVVLDTNNTENDEEGLVKDLISIVTSFSARIYGKRGGKKVSDKIKAILKSGDIDENNQDVEA